MSLSAMIVLEGATITLDANGAEYTFGPNELIAVPLLYDMQPRMSDSVYI